MSHADNGGQASDQASVAPTRPAPAATERKTDVRALLDPGELGEVEGEGLFGGGVPGPVEVFERLEGGEGGVADAGARTGGVAGEDLRLQVVPNWGSLVGRTVKRCKAPS